MLVQQALHNHLCADRRIFGQCSSEIAGMDELTLFRKHKIRLVIIRGPPSGENEQSQQIDGIRRRTIMDGAEYIMPVVCQWTAQVISLGPY
jgi:hypothetical protein